MTLLNNFLFIINNKKTVYLFVNDNNQREKNFIELFDINQIPYKLIFRKKPDYLDIFDNNYFCLNSSILFYLYFFFSKKKILLVSSAYRAFFFSLISKHYVLSAYDVLAGYTYKTFKLRLEKLTIKFTQNFILRDLRLNFFYFNSVKRRSKKFIFIPDCLIKWNDKKNKINDDVLRCAIVGWIDNDKVKLTNVIQKLLLMNVHVHVYSNKMCLYLLKKDFDYFSENYKNFFHIEKPCFGDEFIKALSNYHFGLSPHEIDNQVFPDKNYFRYASSTRVVDYVAAGLVNVFSKKSIYLDFFCRKNNAKKIYMHEFTKINSKKELINLYNDQIETNKIKIKTKYFDKLYLSNKICLFLKKIY